MPYRGPERPRLRPVEIVPVEAEGGVNFALSDPQHVAAHPVVVSTGAVLVLQLLDGEHTLRDVQASIFRATGQLFPMVQIESLVEALDDQLFLDGPQFQAAYRAMREEFLSRRTRPCVLAGASYPADPRELREFLDGLFSEPEGPGLPRHGSGPTDLKALIAPHIDLRRGGNCFAHAYKSLAERSDAEVFVILGIAHYGDGKPYTLTEKDFETPLGVLPTEKAMVARLRELAPPEVLGDEYGHRNEHSIEFQAVLLRYLYPDRSDLSILPILCGSLYESLIENRPPIERPDVRGFVEALRRVIEESGKRTCIISAVDLAHVGKRFGDRQAPDERLLRWVEREDRAMLDSVAALDSDAFFRSLQKDHDRRHVCGYPAIYTMLALFDGEGSPSKGTLVRYEQSPEEETQSAVTFSSMIFT